MHVRLCGINSTHGKDFKIEKPTGFGDYLFLRMKTPTRFYIDGEIRDAVENDIILFRKGDPQYYETLKTGAHVDDYIFFDMDNEEEQKFMDQLELKYNRLLRFPHVQSFMDVHQLICGEFISQNSFQKKAVDCLLRYFLIKLSESMHTDYASCDNAMLERFLELRLAMYRVPEEKWSVNGMAEQMCLSPSYFQSIYKKLFHISCMSDLFISRMNLARELLATTMLPVNEIAAKCGYESNIYFARHFKRKVGMTPSEYRKLWKEY